MPDRLFERLLPQSVLALKVAMTIFEAEGIEGWMHVYIPSDKKAPCEVMASTHGWNLQLDGSSFNARTKKRA